jgi:molybdopterin molybdotransferase
MELDFWKIAMRPGKPLLYGRLGNQRVLGLPGNPVSALVCGLVFLVPMLHRLLGLREGAPGQKEAVLSQDLEANGPREHYMRAVSTSGPGGERLVAPLAAQDSALMADFARADCLIVRAPDAPALTQGARVTIIPLDD